MTAVRETEYVDIGHGVEIQRRYLNDALYGVSVLHSTKMGERCEGGAWVHFHGAVATNDVWQLVREEPLTISPSILCRACGLHGYIREGKWIPA
jgi:hypothetical protein